MYWHIKKENLNIVLIIISSFFRNIANYIFDVGILIYLYDVTQSASVLSGYFTVALLLMVVAFVYYFAMKKQSELERWSYESEA